MSRCNGVGSISSFESRPGIRGPATALPPLIGWEAACSCGWRRTYTLERSARRALLTHTQGLLRLAGRREGAEARAPATADQSPGQFQCLFTSAPGRRGTIDTVCSWEHDPVSGQPRVANSDWPTAVALGAIGDLYVTYSRGAVRRLSVDGSVQTIELGAGSPRGIAVDRDGTIYVAIGHHIVRISAQGVVESLAGTGRPGYSGDGGAATEATLNQPIGLALASDGCLLVADNLNHRVRRISTDGRIETVAGTGEAGGGGDGGPAHRAQLRAPRGLALDDDGNIYIADGLNRRIRRVRGDGLVETIPPSFEAEIVDLAFGPDRRLYVTEPHRVVAVRDDGTREPVAGTGEPGFSGDGGPATDARLWAPLGVVVDMAGTLYIADSMNARIRRLRI